MAIRGQRFTLNPEEENFTFNIEDQESRTHAQDGADLVKDVHEREATELPPPPQFKQSKTGFPQHRVRAKLSSFKQRQAQSQFQDSSIDSSRIPALQPHREPSDRAIVARISRKNGINPDSSEKAEISEENKRRIAQMSSKDIEEARAEIMSSMSKEFLERLLKRANIDEDAGDQGWDHTTTSANEAHPQPTQPDSKEADLSVQRPNYDRSGEENQPFHTREHQDTGIEPQFQQIAPSIHFPVPPRNSDNYVALDPDSPSFLADLKKHYFPELPDDPSTLAWLQDPTEEESRASPYSPEQSRYSASDIRFGFTGCLIAPNDSRDIPVSKGLHHHGEAPESAGYTIPELSILARSVLPNQRCIAYQVLGRVLYRLGRGDFGQRGSELVEGLWGCIERERPLEVMMSEANRAGGHVSAKAYATEALWLWRKGGGGDRGLLKPGEKVAK